MLIVVRNRVKELVDLLQDDSRLKEERRKARKTKDKYVGLSADDAHVSRRRGELVGAFINPMVQVMPSVCCWIIVVVFRCERVSCEELRF